MKYFSFFTAIFLSINSIAQINISQNDMPVANQNYEVYTAISIGEDFAQTGNNHIWDYSNLQYLTESGQNYLPMDSFSILVSAVFNFPFDPNGADYGLRVFEIPIELPVAIPDMFEFYANKSNGFKMLGYALEFGGVPIPVKYDQPDVIYQMPLSSTSSWSGNSSMELDVPGLLYYGSNIDRISLVDGWGTLYLPGDTFEVLRVKSTIVRSDSVYLDSIGSGMQIPPITTTEYHWLAQGQGVPVLKVVDNGIIATAYYTSPGDTTTIQVPEFDKANLQVRLYPNPAKQFVVEYNLEQNSPVEIEIIDIAGRIVQQISDAVENKGFHKKNIVPGENLEAGLYYLRIRSKQGVASKPLSLVK